MNLSVKKVSDNFSLIKLSKLFTRSLKKLLKLTIFFKFSIQFPRRGKKIMSFEKFISLILRVILSFFAFICIKFLMFS